MSLDMEHAIYKLVGSTGPQWTPQNRPYIDSAKPAIARALKAWVMLRVRCAGRKGVEPAG